MIAAVLLLHLLPGNHDVIAMDCGIFVSRSWRLNAEEGHTASSVIRDARHVDKAGVRWCCGAGVW